MSSPAPNQHCADLNPDRLEELAANLHDVRSRMRAAEERSHLSVGNSTLLAVVKRREDREVRALRSLGLESFAESRVQNAAQRPEDLLPSDQLHLVGPLQTNKVRRALELFGTVHSVDRPRLLSALREAARDRPQPLPVYVQVNISLEAQKHGVHPDDCAALCAAVSEAPELRVLGLMAMAPRVPRPEDARPAFAALRELSARLRQDGALSSDAAGLSMGMSGDFEIAIEEGATLVRVGTALFRSETTAPPGKPGAAGNHDTPDR